MKTNISIILIFFFILSLSCTGTYKAPSVEVEEVPSQIKEISSLSTDQVVFIGHTEKGADTTQILNSFRAYVSSFGNSRDGFYLSETVELFFRNGGKQCRVISVDTFVSTSSLERLMNGLEKSEQLSAQIVSIPDAAVLSKGDFYTLQNALLASCEKLRDRFAIVNTYRGTGNLNQLMQQFRNGILSSQFGAAYFPWLQLEDKTVPPLGAIAAIYTKTDQSRGVWKAPANVAVMGVSGLSQKVTESEQGNMNVDPIGGKSVNAIRAFTGKGILAWGARTLAGNNNEWRYISVRRLGIMMEHSIREGLDWAVFEPNNALLWNKTRVTVENYLTELYRQGALQGSKADEAFFVKCGVGETMTETDIDNKKLILEIGFAPVRPAEFIILRFEFKMLVD